MSFHFSFVILVNKDWLKNFLVQLIKVVSTAFLVYLYRIENFLIICWVVSLAILLPLLPSLLLVLFLFQQSLCSRIFRSLVIGMNQLIVVRSFTLTRFFAFFLTAAEIVWLLLVIMALSLNFISIFRNWYYLRHVWELRLRRIRNRDIGVPTTLFMLDLLSWVDLIWLVRWWNKYCLNYWHERAEDDSRNDNQSECCSHNSSSLFKKISSFLVSNRDL